MEKDEKDVDVAAEKESLNRQLAEGKINGVEYNKRIIELEVPKKHDKKKFSDNFKNSPFVYIGFSLLMSIGSIVALTLFGIINAKEYAFCVKSGWPEGIGNCFNTAISLFLTQIYALALVILAFYFASIAEIKMKNTVYGRLLICCIVVTYIIAVVAVLRVFNIIRFA